MEVKIHESHENFVPFQKYFVVYKHGHLEEVAVKGSFTVLPFSSLHSFPSFIPRDSVLIFLQPLDLGSRPRKIFVTFV